MAGYDPASPATATKITNGAETVSKIVNMIRPPKRSVSAPVAIRATEPTRTGIATSTDA